MTELASKFMRPQIQIPRLISLQLPEIPAEIRGRYYFVVSRSKQLLLLRPTISFSESQPMVHFSISTNLSQVSS